MRASLVPAFKACQEPSRTHGPPLAFPACNPPERAGILTVGTPDANGFPANMVGLLRLDAIVGNPGTTADEADIGIQLTVTDVRWGGDPSLDFPYRLYARIPFQLTDMDNGCCGDAATVRDDVSLDFQAQCAENTDPSIGSTCEVATTADALIPGMVHEGQRESWQLRGPVQVYDAGPDSNGDGATLFLTHGLFVP